jgi:lipopolysaccharide export system permease protein
MVLSDLMLTLFSVLAVLVCIIVSRKFLNVLMKALEGEVASDTLFLLLGLKMLTVTVLLLPPALFLGALMVFGRMYRDHEMTILGSAGVGPARLYRAAAYFVLPLTLAAAWGAFELAPWAEAQAQSLVKKDEKTADIRGIRPGRFNEFSGGDVVLYAQSLAEGDNLLSKVFVQSRDGAEMGIVVADRGYLKVQESGETFMVLRDGKRYQGVPGQKNFIVTEFGEYGVRIDENLGKAAAVKREAIPTVALFKSSNPREIAELQRRCSIPLGVLTFGLLSLPLSRMTPRSGVYGNVLTAFLIFIVYENLQKLSQAMTITQKLPIWVGYSGTYALMLVLTMVLLIAASGGLAGLIASARMTGGRS